MSALPDQPGPRYPALLQLLRTSETVWNASRLFFARWNLSPSQFNVLNVLRETPQGLTQVELSRLLIMHRSNVTGLVDRLETRQLLERQPSENDRRSWRVVLTPAGRRLIESVMPHYFAAAEAVWGDLNVTQVNRLALELQQVAQQAERLAAVQPPHP